MGFSILPILLVGLALYAAPAYAFGAGNIASISKIEGTYAVSSSSHIS